MNIQIKSKQLNKDYKLFKVVDSHTMGEPTRVVYEGFPELEGNSMMEKKEFLEKNYDHYRTALMLEPRGHRDMFGALLTEPVSPEADLGVIFMDSGGYLNMCGHGSIGSATVAVETGMVPVTEPYTNVVLEAPAGIIRARVTVENGKAKEVSILNVPAFLYKEGLEISVDEYGVIPFDIAFGGSFFALVDSETINMPIEQNNLERLTDFGMKLRDKINHTIEIKHPYLNITTVDLVEIYGPATNSKADRKNVVIFGDAQADRSPCGTGTSAKVATLYAKGELSLNQEFIYESITGSMFKGMATKEVKIDEYHAIIPQITGSAYITGFNQWIIDDNDPLAYGFLMGTTSDKETDTSRNQFISTAWDLFRTKGYENVSTEDIITESGLTEENFYQYFHSKEDLLYTLSDLFDQRYAELMVEMDPNLSSYDKLLLINKELFTMIEERIPIDLLSYLYSEQMIDSGDKHLLDKERLYYKLVKQIMEEGKSSSEFTSQSSVNELVNDYAMIERGLLCDWCIHKKETSLTAQTNRVMPMFLHGLIYAA